MFLGRGVLKVCGQFTGKHSCRCVTSIKLNQSINQKVLKNELDSTVNINSMSLINQNELNIMATLSGRIILPGWLLFITSRFPHLIISANIMTEPKRKWVPRNKSN